MNVGILAGPLGETPQVTDHVVFLFGLVCNGVVEFQEQRLMETKIESMALEDLTSFVITYNILVGLSIGKKREW